MEFLLCLVLAYVAGSAPWGLIIARFFCNVDPRTSGSGNTGATNVARLCGFQWGVLTLACDVAKGALPVWLAQALGVEPVGVGLVALAAVAGHAFSCFMGFRGGKAVATTIGVFLPLAFWPLLVACLLCLAVIWRTNYVSLGSLTLVTALLPGLLISGQFVWLAPALVIWVLVVYKHRENIERLRAGTEKTWQCPCGKKF